MSSGVWAAGLEVVPLTGDRALSKEEFGLFGKQKFALEAIEDADEVPSLFEVAFIELLGVTDSHKRAIALMASRLIEAGLLSKEEFTACLE